MTDEKIKTCRICLQIIEDEIFHIIGKNTRDTLDLLLVKLDIGEQEQPLMCTNCAEILEKCHSFKVGCLDTEDKIDPYIVDGFKIDLRQVHFNENDSEDLLEVAEDEEICRLCLKISSSVDFISLTETDKETTLVKDIIQKYVPELDLNKTENPMVCEFCHKCLQCYYILVNKYLGAEKIMNQFCTVGERDDQQFMKKGLDIRNEANPFVKHEECFMQIKNEFEDSGTDLVEDGSDCDDTGKSNLFIKIEETKMEAEKGDDESSDWCQPQVVKTEYKQLANSNDVDSDVNPSEVTMHQCELCQFKTTYKRSLKRHIMRHKNPAKGAKVKSCNMCNYTTKYKKCLERHTLLHKNPPRPSNTTIYKCKECSYVTNYKPNFGRHMKCHKHPSQVTMYQCELCQFKTRHKNYLNTHMLCHQKPDEWMHQCEVCDFKTKHKDYLRKHMLMHKKPSEIVMFKCNNCSYESKYKCNLKHHMLSHRDNWDITEIAPYKCELCTYQTRYQSSIKRHMVSHQAEILKCDLCAFETKDKKHMTQHMVCHTDFSELSVYKCEMCPYETKIKRYLTRHTLCHKKDSEVTMYPCEKCEYKTKYRQNLPKHSCRI